MIVRLTDHAQLLLQDARNVAARAGEAEPCIGHLVEALLSDRKRNLAEVALLKSGVPVQQFTSAEGNARTAEASYACRPVDLAELTRVASGIALSRNQFYIGAEHLLLALLDGPDRASFEQYLEGVDVTANSVRENLLEFLGH